MDLTKHDLVPLRTMLKTRDGREAVYLAAVPARPARAGREDKYRVFIKGDKSSSFCYKNGQRFHDHECDADIVAIATKWVPKVGDKVTVNGIAFMYGEGSDYDIMDLPHGEGGVLIVVEAMNASDPNEAYYRFYKLENRAGKIIVTHIDNMRMAK